MDHEVERREDWELSKENIQPLSSGRRLEYLSQCLKSADDEDQEAKINFFESSILNYCGDDPLSPWVKYVDFMEQAYLGDSKPKVALINRCVAKFFKQPQYQNDKRFVDIFIKSMANIPQANRLNLLKQALVKGLGIQLSRMYLALAEDYEASQQYPKAVEILNSGIAANASPLEYLENALTQLQYRVSEKVIKEMKETDKAATAELRNFGDSVPVYGPDNDAPSIRVQLTPAVPTQSKPLAMKDFKHIDVHKDSIETIQSERLFNEVSGSLREGITLPSKKHDKENNLEPAKWNKQENTIAAKDEFYIPNRSQQPPIQLYVEEEEHPVIETKKSKPADGVLSDRTEQPDFKKPNDVNIIAPSNVKICYRKNQLCQNGREITFEHLRAFEYRKRKTITETSAKNDSAVSNQLQRENDSIRTLLKEKEIENQSLQQRLNENLFECEQLQKKAEADRSAYLQKIATLESRESNLHDLETENQNIRTHLADLEESYHALKSSTDKKISELQNAYEKLYTEYERERAYSMSKGKQIQLDMANWKTDMYDQIREEEENRLRREFEDINKLTVAKYEEDLLKRTKELSYQLECEQQRNKDLEKRFIEKQSAENMNRGNIQDSIRLQGDSSIGQRVTNLISSGMSQVNTSSSMYANTNSIPCSSSFPTQTQLYMVNSISNISSTNSSSALTGNTCINPEVLMSTAVECKTFENGNFGGPVIAASYKGNENAPVTAVSSMFPSGSSIVGAVVEPSPRPFKRPTKLPATKKTTPVFSLYESHGETLNQGNSVLQDCFAQRKEPSTIDYNNLPENQPFTGKQLAVKTDERMPLRGLVAPLTPFVQPQPEEQEEDGFIYWPKCDEKTIDFNITNNLTRALAIDRPLLMSTPDQEEKRMFQRRKSLGRNIMATNGPSIYVDIEDFNEATESDQGKLDDKSSAQNPLNFTEAPVIQNLSTIQETSKENRSTYTTSSSSGSNMTTTNMTRGFVSMNNFTRSGSIPASASRHYINQSNTYN